ncbi:MAG TPA: NAD-dependent epimerase/dehydratase family protein [Bryobacteraceae bacterium]|jgi:CDP-paratose 2-epimerase
MKLLITGVCGFVGSALAEALRDCIEGLSLWGIDNLMRPGAESNRARMRELGVQFIHADIRSASDFETLPAVDWVIDAAANPSVLAGIDGVSSSRQLLEHNLASMIHVLEYCKRHRAGLVVLSTSRVYSIAALAALPLHNNAQAFELDTQSPMPQGVSARGLGPDFSTQAPISLYGSTKLASEILALEYSEAFDFPVWVNRCGVLAGAGQFGTPEQGIFAFWVNAHLRRRPLKYIGFDGQGKQVRDALSPIDLADLLAKQMRAGRKGGSRLYTVGGGPANAMSLSQLNAWCDARFGVHAPTSDLRPRPYDIPWIAMDNSGAQRDFAWTPACGIGHILSEIADHAQQHPDWLQRSGL